MAMGVMLEMDDIILLLVKTRSDLNAEHRPHIFSEIMFLFNAAPPTSRNN